MSDHFRTLARLMRDEVQGPVYDRLYREARVRHPVFAAYPDLLSLLAVLAQDGGDDYTERDAITLALLRERATAHESHWSAVLTVVYLPMLLRLRRQLVCAELPKDDLDQLVLESFLVAIASYRPDSWRGRTPIRLTHLTRRRVFKTLRKELMQRRWREDQQRVLEVTSGQASTGSASTAPIGFRVDAVLAALADHVSEEGAFLVRETELGPETLFSVVAKMNVEGGEERERLYQRLKRVRSRAKKRLRDAIVESPLGPPAALPPRRIPMPGRSSRRKGADFEREMVHRFAQVFGEDRVQRGMQFRDGSECADVVAPALHIECKRGARTNPRAALAQATEDSLGKGLWPIAVCKDDKEQAFVTLHLDDFLDLLREWWAARSR